MQTNENKKKFIKDFLNNAKQKILLDLMEIKPALKRTANSLWEVNNFTISPIDEPAIKQNLRSILEE